MNIQEKRFALLIDAENIGAQYIKTVIEEMANYGIVTYKRIYADWTKPDHKSWKDVLLNYSITPIQQYAYTSGKNSSDSAMIIDAMDILYSNSVDGFCIVSSDSDFTRLAVRLKEAGMTVVGMGKQQTPAPFINACSFFKYIDIIGGTADAEKESELAEAGAVTEPTEKPKASKKASKKKRGKATATTEVAEDESATPTPSVTSPEEIKAYIKKCIEEKSDDTGYMLMSDLGALISKKFPAFDTRNYGKKKLSPLLKDWGFETKDIPNPNNTQNPSGHVSYVKL